MTSTLYYSVPVPIVIAGYGSIGRGVLPLVVRHFKFQPDQLHIIAPSLLQHPTQAEELRKKCYNVHQIGLEKSNFESVLGGIVGTTDPDPSVFPFRGIVINVTVDVGSLDMTKWCRANNCLHIDTVVEPWAGYYSDESLGPAKRTNYALRQQIQDEKAKNPGGTTALCCVGANPGMVSWFVKEALLILANDTLDTSHFSRQRPPQSFTRGEWAQLMCDLGVQGVHIAERDTQYVATKRPYGTFRNTWSVEGFIAEGRWQSSELGFGAHEKWTPPNAERHTEGCLAGIFFPTQCGVGTRVRSWCPTLGSQFAFLVTHNESISIADYYTIGPKDHPVFRPTAHYAYRPCADAVDSCAELLANPTMEPIHHLFSEKEIQGGVDELGVLLYGHKKNAIWFGSTLSHEETIQLAPEQSATGLQVTSAIIAGIVWAIENPKQGIVEADEMDHVRCLEVQKPYLGKLWHSYTDWNPRLACENGTVPPQADSPFPEDPWQFCNVLIH